MKTQRGNILFLILLAVVLFAALSYAVTSSMRGGGKSGADESAQAQTADLMNYFAQLDTAVQRMMLTGGVKDYQLNFGTTPHYYILQGNDNTNCLENRCRVFHQDGGAVSGRELDAFTRKNSADKERIFYTSIPGVGTSAPDIVFVLQGAKTGICREINKRIGQEDIIWNTEQFTGTATQTIMYQNPIPVGPIPDTGSQTLVTPSIGSAGTFCICTWSDTATCESNDYRPMIFHVLVAR